MMGLGLRLDRQREGREQVAGYADRSALERSGARDLPEGMRVRRVKIVEGQKGPEVAEIEPE